MYEADRGGVQVGEYYYNPLGQLVLRIVTNSVPSGWFSYFCDQAGDPIAEYDGISEELIREYVWLGDTPIAVIEAGTTPTTYYIHTDHIGRPKAMTDAGGSFVNETDYVAFGNIWSSTGSVGADLRFPGQMYQHETGLFYNWNRSYAPTIARYTQPDPLGPVDGPSRYAYAGSDPLQKVDPSGLQMTVVAKILLDYIYRRPPFELPPSAGMCVPNGDFDWRDMVTFPSSEEKAYCDSQYEKDIDQYYENHSYSISVLRSCLDRAEQNWSQCRRGLPDLGTWKDKDTDGLEPPKRPKR